MYQLDKAYCLSPTRFSLESFLEMKEATTSLPALRQELLVRLAHLQMFLFSLEGVPQAVQAQESFLELLHLQAQNFRDVLLLINIGSAYSGSDKVLTKLHPVTTKLRRLYIVRCPKHLCIFAP